MTELEVPQHALDCLLVCHSAAVEEYHQPSEECVRHIAESVVVAELRRLLDAAEHTRTPLGALVVTRADELEAGA